MINLFICIISLIVGIIIAKIEYKWQKNNYKNSSILLMTIAIICRFFCFFVTGFFLAETIKYFMGMPTLIF